MIPNSQLLLLDSTNWNYFREAERIRYKCIQLQVLRELFPAYHKYSSLESTFVDSCPSIVSIITLFLKNPGFSRGLVNNEWC